MNELMNEQVVYMQISELHTSYNFGWVFSNDKTNYIFTKLAALSKP